MLFILFLFFVAQFYSFAQSAITVNGYEPRQIIHGLGGSAAWHIVTDSESIQLFSNKTSTAFGLTLFRVRIAPNELWKTSTYAWARELGNARKAINLGARVMATPWTPPASMKTNNNVVGGSLKLSSYSEYAQYLQSFVTYYRLNGVHLIALSLQNEPDITVSYESCHWTADQIRNFVRDHSSIITAPFMIPESYKFNQLLSNLTLLDPNARDNVKLIGGHIYGSGLQPYPYATSLGKEVWMTEHYLKGITWADGIILANEVHQSFAYGKYNAYLFWWMKADYGLIDQSSIPTKKGFAFAQYARFIKPDSTRYSVIHTSTPILLSAYVLDNSTTMVVLNPSSTSITESITLRGPHFSTITKLYPWISTATLNLKSLPSISITGSLLKYTFPASSITTFVI